ncbi:MAG: hypothetical protein JRJ59_13220, partial [Deltaproteobacteria bacterium]|nr:hypothetical protein [Deltaproteobacteria bacterium]
YLPGLTPEETNKFHLLPGEPLFRAAQMILRGRTEELFKTALFNLRPATQDRPYFFSFFRPATLGLISTSQGHRLLPVTEWGLLFIWGGLGSILLLAGAGIFLPLLKIKPRPRGLVYFGLIGLGYMLAEMTLLAETIYQLGRPALAIPLVIGLFLVISGLGSLLWGGRPPKAFALASAAALPLTLLALRHLPVGPLTVGLTLAPAALLMGVPFAGGLVHLAGSWPQARAWAFGINGFFSVIGSLTATLICLQAGHLVAVALAGGCYLLAGLEYRRIKS